MDVTLSELLATFMESPLVQWVSGSTSTSTHSCEDQGHGAALPPKLSPTHLNSFCFCAKHKLRKQTLSNSLIRLAFFDILTFSQGLTSSPPKMYLLI